MEGLVKAFCDTTFHCCAQGEVSYYLGPFVDPATCADRIGTAAALDTSVSFSVGVPNLRLSLPNLGMLDRAIREGRTSINEGALNGCISYLKWLACNAPPPDAGAPPTTCTAGTTTATQSPCDQKMFEGRVDEGGRCLLSGASVECKTGLVCRSWASGAEGTCVKPSGVGGYCFVDAECTTDLYCSQLDGTCQHPRNAGESCQYADPDNMNPDPSTLLVECAAGLSCDPVSDTCVAPCHRGARCSVDRDCDVQQGLVCVMSRCDLPRADGQPCQDATDCQSTRCIVDPAHPTMRICAPRLADNMPCSSHLECSSGFCDVRTFLCTPKVAPPGLCPSANSTQCQSGYCDTTFISCSGSANCKHREPATLRSRVANITALRSCPMAPFARAPSSVNRPPACRDSAGRFRWPTARPARPTPSVSRDSAASSRREPVFVFRLRTTPSARLPISACRACAT